MKHLKIIFLLGMISSSLDAITVPVTIDTQLGQMRQETVLCHPRTGLIYSVQYVLRETHIPCRDNIVRNTTYTLWVNGENMGKHMINVAITLLVRHVLLYQGATEASPWGTLCRRVNFDREISYMIREDQFDERVRDVIDGLLNEYHPINVEQGLPNISH